jgi:hypothetical protein
VKEHFSQGKIKVQKREKKRKGGAKRNKVGCEGRRAMSSEVEMMFGKEQG